MGVGGLCFLSHVLDIYPQEKKERADLTSREPIIVWFVSLPVERAGGWSGRAGPVDS